MDTVGSSHSSGNASELPPGTQLLKGKVVVIGEYSVGKTSLSNRFVLQHCPQKTEPTIGAAFQLRTILLPGTNQAVRLEIWDTAGSERYRSLMPMYYRDASAAVVCYDTCNGRSFERITSWIDDFRKSAEQSDTNPNPLVLLVGTKSDLAAQGKREIQTAIAQEFARQEGLVHMETSAKLNENVTEVFLAAAQHIVKEAKEAQALEKERIQHQGHHANAARVGGSGRPSPKVDLRDEPGRRRRGDDSDNSRCGSC